ncbi:MAG: universal stress protein [Gemmataceae bacterium]|nr:universal stress protein [Gemmataceae bacterium]
MFRKILLPVDLTDKHARALEAAAALGGQAGGEVTLLHVVELIPGLSMEEEKSFYDRLETLARQHLEQLGQALRQRGVNWRSEILFGKRGPDIVRFAREQGTELIVLTAPHVDPTQPAAGWGSLSYKVGLFAPCPVLLVK